MNKLKLNNYFEVEPIIEKINNLDKTRLKNYKHNIKANTTIIEKLNNLDKTRLKNYKHNIKANTTRSRDNK